MSIIGKFLKIAGKDPNGNAKGVAVTENGEVKVQQTGSIVSDIRTLTIAEGTHENIILNVPGGKYARIYLGGVAGGNELTRIKVNYTNSKVEGSFDFIDKLVSYQSIDNFENVSAASGYMRTASDIMLGPAQYHQFRIANVGTGDLVINSAGIMIMR